jgi:hypothetical protein
LKGFLVRKFLCLLLIIAGSNLAPVLSASARFKQIANQQQQEQTQSPLVNKDVLEMLKSGLSQDVVIAKIKTSLSKFDTSPTALQELKTGNVPDAVILAMVNASAGTSDDPSMLTVGKAGVEVKVPDGTPLEIELLSNISSATAKEGDIVDFTIVNPVVVGGVTVIEKGAPAKARIAAVKKAGYWGKAGRLGWAMQDVLAADGNRISLRMEKKLTGDSKGGTVATGAIVTAMIFFPAAPFWGFKKGKNAVYPAGKRFEAFVNGDVVVKGKTGAVASPVAQP